MNIQRFCPTCWNIPSSSRAARSLLPCLFMRTSPCRDHNIHQKWYNASRIASASPPLTSFILAVQRAGASTAPLLLLPLPGCPCRLAGVLSPDSSHGHEVLVGWKDPPPRVWSPKLHGVAGTSSGQVRPFPSSR